MGGWAARTRAHTANGSVGDLSGAFGAVLLVVVVEATCSFSAAFTLLGVLLTAGGALALSLRDTAAVAKLRSSDCGKCVDDVSLQRLRSAGVDIEL